LFLKENKTKDSIIGENLEDGFLKKKEDEEKKGLTQ